MQVEKPLVLIADDEHNAVMLLTRVFKRDGFVVESAKDGMSALEKARALRPDLILMDVQMPEMNGFEVVARLREDPATERIPIIFVTAAARTPTDAVHGLKLGADDYIRKPYDHHELLARAHSKMRARQLEDRLQRRSGELEALVRIGGEFNQRLGLGELANLILDVASQELCADHVELYLLDEKPLRYRSTASGERSVEALGSSLANENTIAGWVFRTEDPLLVTDTEQSMQLTAHLHDLGLSSAIAAPLKHHGRLVGLLVVACGSPRHFSDSDLRLLRSIGEQAALAVRNAQLYAELQSYAQNLEDMVEVRTQELRTTQAQLVQTEKLAALGRLAAGVAHEVNNPLQPILNCLEVAIEDVESKQRVDAEVLRVAEKEVQRIKAIVSRLLDFSRPNTGEMVKVNLHALITEVLGLAAKQLERMDIRVVADLATVGPLRGNPAQIKQVILNLVLNAMEAMPGGGDLTIRLYDVKDGVRLEIEDTGVGMDSQTVNHLFEPFYSTKENGTGLGLSTSYGIIESHGGNIQVESKPGAGSCFTIWLPRLL
ncbi:MAG: response regulator [Anaerolineae bacterium]|jgi:signal transduction histidine kinase/DNA-binding response OmpR family regulator|nr:response regulator [Anaerolineae bacterium]